jgi:hypothetical protein
MPRLPFASGHDLIFREGAIATFEIKTNIFPSGLDSIGENIESVRLLDPGPSDGVTEMGDLTNWPWNRVLSVVVTYEGAVLPAIATKLEAMVEAKRPDIYVDLPQGIMLKNDGLILPPQGTDPYMTVADPAIGLARLLAILSKFTGRIMTRGVKWESYLA